ncbi:MAG TPA: DHH family phosphoesterase [Archaeoglobaceae archaeon]|nr:DHH family phosphoesterase [Archaeoglobaceae archaeon]
MDVDAREKEVLKRARRLAEIITKQSYILVVTHIDADGITSGSIAKISLERAGIENDIIFLKQLDEEAVEKIADKNVFVWFTDLGSGQINLIEKYGINYTITDHHVPQGKTGCQLNPHDFGLDGSYELSGSTTTYLVAEQMGLNYDLVPLAITGAVGDLQDLNSGKLVGLNRNILKYAVKNGFVEAFRDLRLFGKQTRPVYKMLEYTYDPFLPGISGNEKASLDFMEKANVPPKNSDGWRRWIDLIHDEKLSLASEIVKLCIYAGYPLDTIKKLVGETYILTNEEEGTEIRDAMEFSTLLNATARYGHEEIGLKVCMGDRDNAFRRARYLLQNHRRNLSEGLKLVDKIGIKEMDNLQYFHAENRILDTIVGIVAGMCFSKANLNKPIVAFANKEDGIKVSARATHRLVSKGIHLANALKIAAEKVGGKGGGHPIAAGATIPDGREPEFLKELNTILARQSRGSCQHAD